MSVGVGAVGLEGTHSKEICVSAEIQLHDWRSSSFGTAVGRHMHDMKEGNQCECSVCL